MSVDDVGNLGAEKCEQHADKSTRQRDTPVDEPLARIAKRAGDRAGQNRGNRRANRFGGGRPKEADTWSRDRRASNPNCPGENSRGSSDNYDDNSLERLKIHDLSLEARIARVQAGGTRRLTSVTRGWARPRFTLGVTRTPNATGRHPFGLFTRLPASFAGTRSIAVVVVRPYDRISNS